jgi:uncharacterized membrane protein YfcA
LIPRKSPPGPAPVHIITDPSFYLVALPAVTFLGLAKGGFAGAGLLATPLLALYLPPREAAALLLPILLCQDAISVFWYRRDWDPWNLKVLLPGAVIGMGAAWLFAAQLSDAWLRLTVGGIGIAFCLNAFLRRGNTEPQKKSAASGAFWGAVSGFTSFLNQAGGPPFQVHVLPQRLPKMTLVGTTTIFFAIVNFLKIGPYFALGQFTMKNFATSLALLPIAVATNFLGIWLVRRTPTEIFYRIAYGLVFFVSIALVWQGISSLAHG